MATPELVIADAPFKSYPGNVIAVRCADWLAGARGTLSTESDALASTGQTVRDTQQVTGIITDTEAAYAAADDTLEISGLPFVADRYYEVWFTARIEGYLDVTDGPVLRESFNENWAYATVGGVHGVGLYTWNDETTPLSFFHCPPPLPYYRAMHLAGSTAFRVQDPSEPIFFRLASEAGTTIEWLLDQIVFLPFVYNEVIFNGTDARTTFVDVEDGADGGDANGKFTWFPRQPKDGFSATGDYQHKSDGDDAEFFARVTVDDVDAVFDGTGFDGEADSFFYSLHTANYRGQRTWTEDTFDNRDTSGASPDSDMGVSPEGYGYGLNPTVRFGPPSEAFVDGAGSGVLRLNEGLTAIGIRFGDSPTTYPSDANANQGIRFQLYDQWSWSGVWEWTAGALNPGYGFLTIFPTVDTAGVTIPPLLCFDLTAGLWGTDGDVGPFPNDISSWFGLGALVGFRFEQKRYRYRLRVWDASGAEPSTWDIDDYLIEIAGAGDDAYPYDDDENKSTKINFSFTALDVVLESTWDPDNTLPYDISFHNLKVEHDPYGDSADMVVRIERPEGTTAGEITVPFGSSYFVNWGKRDWTEDNGFGGLFSVEFSAKVWDTPGAAEIQRAEAQIFYLFWIPGGHIIPMNWRSSDRRNSANRVLLGSR